MAVEWTTAALVREALGNLNGKSTISDAEIEEKIEQSEGFVETIFKIPASFAFNSAKKPHKAIRKLVTLLTALQVMSNYSMSFITLQHAQNFEDVTVNEIDRIMSLFERNTGYIDFIKAS